MLCGSTHLNWSSAVYPTQAKVRLEWGTHLLLAVHRKFEVATTRQLSHPLPVPAAKAGCPIQAVFWLEWDTTALDQRVFPHPVPPRKKQALVERLLLRTKETKLIGHQHGINYLDFAVRLIYVRDGNCRCSALLVGENDLAALHHCCQRTTLHRGQHCLAAARLDLLGDVFRGDLTGHYVVGEDLLQLRQIFRL